MNPLLEQFLAEAREFLQGIGEKLMQLEQAPGDADLMNELFRLVHTLKGNSGLFEFSEMTRVLHAGEDLMDAVKNGQVVYSQKLADQLLDAMDFVGILCGEIESDGCIAASRATDSARLASGLRALIENFAIAETDHAIDKSAPSEGVSSPSPLASPPLSDIPEAVRMEAYGRTQVGDSLYSIFYTPAEECFYQGDDPLFTVRQTPDMLWGRIVQREPWPPLAEFNAYRCVLDFHLLVAAPREELTEHYRYMPEQVNIIAVDPLLLVIPQGDTNGKLFHETFISDTLQYLEAGDIVALKQAAQNTLELSNPKLWISSALRWLLLLSDSVPDNRAVLRTLIASFRTLTPPDWAAAHLSTTDATSAAKDVLGNKSLLVTGRPNTISELSKEYAAEIEAIFATQRQILMLDDHPAWHLGRIKAVAGVLANCCKAMGDLVAESEIESALQQALVTGDSASMLGWLDARYGGLTNAQTSQTPIPAATIAILPESGSAPANADQGIKFGRRADDAFVGPKSLKVDQTKVDRLMNLIGEMVVAKNALPYLAQRAENQFGVRELAREIKAQYAVINRIAEEMQDAIMQVRMMAVSFIFQRFPRLVRDIARNLGKEVQLVFEGEETEADKNIIESLADPLIHIVRNSLDHGLETPDVRRACGKPVIGKLTIRAAQEADQVVIEIQDDGKGIDPIVIKRKAYEKGVIDEATLERISDRDAVNLVFAPGFSTAEVVSDLSGRGVGMDVVRTAVEKVNGTILMQSDVGKGTCIRISLPLSMAVTQVMIVESDRQKFGVPMSHVVETVRLPRTAIHAIKNLQTTVLRGRIVPLRSLNALLGLPAEPKANDNDELAVLVVRVGSEAAGLIVDDLRETVDVIQKPLTGALSGLAAYSGSALMGDGSVLMVLNVKEIM